VWDVIRILTHPWGSGLGVSEWAWRWRVSVGFLALETSVKEVGSAIRDASVSSVVMDGTRGCQLAVDVRHAPQGRSRRSLETADCWWNLVDGENASWNLVDGKEASRSLELLSWSCIYQRRVQRASTRPLRVLPDGPTVARSSCHSSIVAWAVRLAADWPSRHYGLYHAF